MRRDQSEDPKFQIQREIVGNEKVLWTGIPKQGIMFRGSDIFLIPFSLLWGGFAFFWEFMALSSIGNLDDPFGLIFPLFGIPFVLVGIYLIIGRFFVDAYIRSRTYYGLTDSRAIIIGGLFGRQIRSLNLNSTANISLKEGSDDRGTLIFGQDSAGAAFAVGGWPMGSGQKAPRFESIAGARHVFSQIRKIQSRLGYPERL